MDLRRVLKNFRGRELTQKEKCLLSRMISKSNRISREQQLFIDGRVGFKVLVEMIVVAVTSCPDINHISKEFFGFLKKILEGHIDVSKRGDYISKHIGYSFDDFRAHDSNLTDEEEEALCIIESVVNRVELLQASWERFMEAVLVLWDKIENPGFCLLRAFVVLIEDSDAWRVQVEDIYEFFFLVYDMSMDWGNVGIK